MIPLSLLLNKYTIAGIVIAGMSAGIWWYKDKAEDVQAEYEKLKAEHSLSVEQVKRLQDIRKLLELDYQKQKDIAISIENNYNNAREELKQLKTKVDKLQGYVGGLDEEIAKNPEQKEKILSIATIKLNSELDKSILCLELSTESESCDDE